jgi:RND family efflux transporter MFP subunit
MRAGMTRMKRWWIGGGFLLALGAGLAGLSASRNAGSERAGSLGHDAEAREAEPAGQSGPSSGTRGEGPESTLAPLPVVAVRVELGPFALTIRASGRAASRRRVDLSARVGERVKAVRVREGDHVREGELLVELEDRPYAIALREAEARRANAEVDYHVALLADSSASPEKRQLTAHRTGLTEAQQRFERAALDLESARVSAPFAGIVGNVRAVEGANVLPNEPLVTLLDAGSLRIPAEVLESDFGRLEPGAAAVATFAAFPGLRFEGRVAALSPECNPQTSTGIAYIELANPDPRVVPGMYAEVDIEADRLDDRLVVPRRAVLERDRRLLVFRAVDGRAEWQYVTTGVESDDAVEITSGLSPGDVVLVDGHLTLAHGAPISVTLLEE